MINTNELMLGNYCKIKNDKLNNLMQVVGTSETEVLLDYNENKGESFVVDCNDLVPILITEEILEKCGFYKCDRLNDMPANYYSNDEGNKIGYHKESDKYLLIGMYCEFKYLHELQNIYYLLTKKQLKVNLND